MVYYLEKWDINEELVRLQHHLDYFQTNLDENTPTKGKKLGFIAQEMGREINTIGSKANDASYTFGFASNKRFFVRKTFFTPRPNRRFTSFNRLLVWLVCFGIYSHCRQYFAF